jgi:mRNA-degrading endonuclease toxin of MazEF toxin-antitoxin module
VARRLNRGETETGSHPHARFRNWPPFDGNSGAPSEVILDVDDGMKVRCAVNLHNAVTVSQERLSKPIASLGDERMQQVCAALRVSLGCG